MLNIEEINSFDEFVKLEPIWNDLLAQSDADCPFLTFEWLCCWWQSFGKNSDLMIIIARQGNEVAALAPLMKKRITWRGFPAISVNFIANYHSNRSGLIIVKRKERIFYEIIKYIKKSVSRLDVLCFDFIVKDSITDILLKEALSINTMKYREMKSLSSPYIPISGSWSDFKRGKSRNFRHKINRVENKFRRHGNYEILKYTNNNIHKAMSELITVSGKSWKFKKKTAIASHPMYIDFYTLLAQIASRKNWLNIWILKLDDKPISFAFNLVYKNKVFACKIGYDHNHTNFAPGEFLNAIAIKDCFDAGMTEYDWLGEGLPFKTKWTSFSRKHTKYRIFHDCFYGRFLGMVESAVPMIKRSLEVKMFRPKIRIGLRK